MGAARAPVGGRAARAPLRTLRAGQDSMRSSATAWNPMLGIDAWSCHHLVEALRRKVLVAVTVGEHEATDALQAGVRVPRAARRGPPPVSLPTSVTSRRSRVSSGWDASGGRPSRQIGQGQRDRRARRAARLERRIACRRRSIDNVVPHRAPATHTPRDEDHRRAVTRDTRADGPLVEVDGLFGRRTSPASVPARARSHSRGEVRDRGIRCRLYRAAAVKGDYRNGSNL